MLPLPGIFRGVVHVVFDNTLKAMNILGAHACERAGLSTLNEHARMLPLLGIFFRRRNIC